MASLVALATGIGAASSQPPVGIAGVRVADAYARAVYVDHDCATAKRLTSFHGGSWVDCHYLQRMEWRYRLVRGSRRLRHHCQPNGSLPVFTSSGDCLTYQIVGLHRVTGPYGGKGTAIWFGTQRVFPRQIEGAWKVVAADFVRNICLDTDPATKCPQRRLWERRIRLHTDAPLGP